MRYYVSGHHRIFSMMCIQWKTDERCYCIP